MKSLFYRFAHGEATEQEFFDGCATAMLAQGKPAVSAGGNCMYTAPDGCHCAIGLQLSPEELAKATRSHNDGVPAGVLMDTLYAGLTPATPRNFANVMQKAHDNAAQETIENCTDDFLSRYKANMREAAESQNLRMECVAD